MKIQYESINFKPATLKIIHRAIDILEDYENQGFQLTLRQLYYQFVSKGLIDNKQTEYKRLGSIVNDARMAGLIDWDHIEDRTRNLSSIPHFNDPPEIIEQTSRWYRMDKWKDQPNYVEVWVEKDALVGVLKQACQPLDVPFFSCRGYTSQSEMWGAAQRIGEKMKEGKNVTILHLGDHDPSGIDMTRDIRDRIEHFVDVDEKLEQQDELYDAIKRKLLPETGTPDFVEKAKAYLRANHKMWGGFYVDRIALNMDQVRMYDPPPNPAKLTDSRGSGYVDMYGEMSWELDALEPSVITDLIEGAVIDLRDEDLWENAVAKEEEGRSHLREVSQRWDEVEEMIAG